MTIYTYFYDSFGMLSIVDENDSDKIKQVTKKFAKISKVGG